MKNIKNTVSLFIPCIVDQVYPEIGVAMVKVLRHLGYQINYNSEQTCCGQPAFNAGQLDEARKVASHFLKVFENEQIIICPSGSCTGMVRNYYTKLFKNHSLQKSADEVSKRVFEFSEFLDKNNAINKLTGRFSGNVGFHNSCHSYREIGIKEQPIKILNQIKGLVLKQPDGEPVCCGFGGLFSFKFHAIAETMAKSRIEQFTNIGADTIVSNDPGCILHLRQETKLKNDSIRILHLTEFLAEAMGL